jgi:WD40 repeat protein
LAEILIDKSLKRVCIPVSYNKTHNMTTPTAIFDPLESVKVDDFVAALTWSPDSQSLAVAGGEGKVCLLTRAGGSLAVKEMGEHLLGTVAIQWQSNGPRFASAGQDGAVQIFDANQPEQPSIRIQPSRQAAAALAWSPSGDHLACATGKSIFQYDIETATSTRVHDAESGITGLTYDKTGQTLAASRNGGVDVHRWNPAHQCRHYTWASPCLNVLFSPNGKFLVTGTQDGAVHFWYLATGKDSQMRGYPDKVDCLSWRHDSRYLATAAGEQLVIWDFGGRGPEGSRPLQLKSHSERIQACAFQPVGPYLASIGRDWRLSLWQPGKFDIDLDAHMTAAEPTSLAWSPDGRFVAVGTQAGDVAIYGLRLVA